MKEQQSTPTHTQASQHPLSNLLEITDFDMLQEIIIDAFSKRIKSNKFKSSFSINRQIATCQVLAEMLTLIAAANKEVCHE